MPPSDILCLQAVLTVALVLFVIVYGNHTLDHIVMTDLDMPLGAGLVSISWYHGFTEHVHQMLIGACEIPGVATAYDQFAWFCQACVCDVFAHDLPCVCGCDVWPVGGAAFIHQLQSTIHQIRDLMKPSDHQLIVGAVGGSFLQRLRFASGILSHIMQGRQREVPVHLPGWLIEYLFECHVSIVSSIAKTGNFIVNAPPAE